MSLFLLIVRYRKDQYLGIKPRSNIASRLYVWIDTLGSCSFCNHYSSPSIYAHFGKHSLIHESGLLIYHHSTSRMTIVSEHKS